MASRLEMMVPVGLLPSEGEDVPEFKTKNGSATRGDLLRHYLAITQGSHVGFRIGRDGISALDGGEGVILQHSHFGLGEAGDNGGQPWFDFSDRSATLDVSPILAEEEGVEMGLGEDAGAEDYLRAFLEHFTTRVEEALGDLEGTAIPLLRWWESSDGDGVEVGFCGVVVADVAMLASLRDGEGEEGTAFDPYFGVVLEAPEVEGKGLREIALSLAVLGIAVAGTAEAEAGSKRFGTASTASASSQNSLMAALSGVKLFDYNKNGDRIETIRANNVQAPAKINRSLLAEADGASRQVVVDVEKQRAYVIINGEIAIDTPVSTAREGKYTPRGEFKITQRVKSGKTSTIYGCDLPYWQRLDESAVGMHVGPLPGYPASAGCIRLPEQVAPIIFEATARGVTVRVLDSWERDEMVASL